ncbi:glycogen debranching protein GlgX [Aurantiacibacter marinus]|uniref:Glycogen debranching protein n=1 Tax=Aurantiacibacter marinus TaxID=874156 RepID=A0A0H0XLM8_9SPHN|nr:glycogen debranching protein GlgX [Aurantiacibacter marinus]KLI62896.1 glycogen debranching protein [Aurantiacibacter marinus]
MTPAYGATSLGGVTHFRVRSPQASALWLCLFDGADERRIPMDRQGDDWFAELAGQHAGAAYGYRADGEWAPEHGLWFDPAKLLVDPYAVELDRRFVQDPALTQFGVDTAHLVPRAIVPMASEPVRKEAPKFQRGGLIYEINVRGFTMLHPDVPKGIRGTVAALAHPAVLAHLKKLHVSAIELMPITAWIDERHLGPLGLSNAWGYNPVAMMALDPGLCPGGVAELRKTAAALHDAGIGVILDLVFNHTGESDIHGGVISLRGLDNAGYAHAPDGSLINDTGCGNTLDFANPAVRELTVASLHHFVRNCGVDGFRFDLAPIMARGPGFSADAPIFAEIAADPLLADRVMIAEPWDIGPGGYQLGNFPADWLEWNDKYRDDVRRFWRGDGTIGDVVTRIAGSSDIFPEQCRSVNFLAAHDGFTLADSVAYLYKHNEANGEANRDGHGENFSWNCGVEGPSDDPEVLACRDADLRALLSTLFASTGTIMLTAGDEFGRSQRGNNNAYAQDNEIGWVDWKGRDLALESFTADLAKARAEQLAFFTSFPQEGEWVKSNGEPMGNGDWQEVGVLKYRLNSANLSLSISREGPTKHARWRPA